MLVLFFNDWLLFPKTRTRSPETEGLEEIRQIGIWGYLAMVAQIYCDEKINTCNFIYKRNKTETGNKNTAQKTFLFLCSIFVAFFAIFSFYIL